MRLGLKVRWMSMAIYKHHFMPSDYDADGVAQLVTCMFCDCKPYHADEPCIDQEQEARADYLVSVHVEEARMEEG